MAILPSPLDTQDQYAAVERLTSSTRPKLVFVTHALGGGTERHIQDLVAMLADVAEVLVQALVCKDAIGKLHDVPDACCPARVLLSISFDSCRPVARTLIIVYEQFHHRFDQFEINNVSISSILENDQLHVRSKKTLNNVHLNRQSARKKGTVSVKSFSIAPKWHELIAAPPFHATERKLQSGFFNGNFFLIGV